MLREFMSCSTRGKLTKLHGEKSGNDNGILMVIKKGETKPLGSTRIMRLPRREVLSDFLPRKPAGPSPSPPSNGPMAAGQFLVERV